MSEEQNGTDTKQNPEQSEEEIQKKKEEEKRAVRKRPFKKDDPREKTSRGFFKSVLIFGQDQTLFHNIRNKCHRVLIAGFLHDIFDMILYGI